MKRVSRATIVSRIKRGHNICPVCGCKKRIINNHDVGYPDIWVDERCSNCGKVLCIADNSPFYEVCDFIRESKHITYKVCVNTLKEFNNHY